jgi:hypothetical protein
LDRFIVGTGRCGSTLLSRMLAGHPDVCSIFEFFTGLDWGRRFASTPMSGSELAALLSTPNAVVTAVLRRGYEVEEITYPFGRGRYRRDEPLPWILVSMLPRLSGDPDRLFDEVMAFARVLQAEPPAQLYRRLFEWLAARAGSAAWIERSGSSVDYLASLDACFPEARFLHLHRDGPETALSMREHHAYRLPIALLYDAPLDTGERPSELGPLDLGAPPTPGDPITRILASRPSAAAYGRYWSDQVGRGTDAAARIPSERLLALPFEELLAAPRETLRRIATFFVLPEDGAWIERAAALVRGAPPARLPALAPAERESLLEACRPGQRRLGRT